MFPLKKGENEIQTPEEETGTEAKITYPLNQDAIDKEARFDGFYAMEANLLDTISDIISVTKGRWEIE